MLVDSIVQKSGIKSTDIILEIGPGTGNLTKKLLEAGKSVIAVELDSRMVLELQRRFQGTPFSNKLKSYPSSKFLSMQQCGVDFTSISKQWHWKLFSVDNKEEKEFKRWAWACRE
ncbi:unnamed protein product [Linum trigynum]|uniref:rRNA adenine N(6)-methyltransferase n=1 Tax=Linum trigynum TaxID=586398 RepID=A0AAV2GF63_9ROSI